MSDSEIKSSVERIDAKMARVIIIGNGPAGISAALYTKRANIETIIIGKGYGSLEKADKIENYYGFAEPVSGKYLVEQGIEQAKNVGCTYVEGEVVGMSFFDRPTVSTNQAQYVADAVIMATGSSRQKPEIEGLDRLEGAGVSYCAVCDAFFHRGKDVAVLGSGAYAMHEAGVLLPVTRSVTILTNGEEITGTVPKDVLVKTERIERLIGHSTNENVLGGVQLSDGSIIELSGLFVAVGIASSSDLARKIGAECNDKSIAVNEKMETNIKGLFAAGDCVGGLLQISKAVGDGAKAGMSAISYIKNNGL